MAIELVVPPLGESISEAVVAKWLKAVGDQVALDEPIAELETDKVTVTLPAPSAGVLTEQLVQVGGTVNVGGSIGRIDGALAPQQVEKTPPLVSPTLPTPLEKKSTPAPVLPPPSPLVSVPLSPNTRKILREAGHSLPLPVPVPVSSSQVPQAESPKPSASSAEIPRPPSAPEKDEEVVSMSPLRKRIAERLVEAQRTAAILTTFNEVDLLPIQTLRQTFQDEFVKKHGVKLGLMSFFVRACELALKEFRGLNAEFREGAIAYKKHYHFGIAVGSGKGLVVPVLRHVDRLSLAQIEQGILELAQKAKDGKLALADLEGGTFSISNGGVYGSMMSTPLLNMPQTGILGMHNIIKRPVAVGDNIELRPMMYLALSYDHRVVDGREAVSFLVRVKERLESPEKILLAL